VEGEGNEQGGALVVLTCSGEGKKKERLGETEIAKGERGGLKGMGGRSSIVGKGMKKEAGESGSTVTEKESVPTTRGVQERKRRGSMVRGEDQGRRGGKRDLKRKPCNLHQKRSRGVCCKGTKGMHKKKGKNKYLACTRWRVLLFVGKRWRGVVERKEKRGKAVSGKGQEKPQIQLS